MSYYVVGRRKYQYPVFSTSHCTLESLKWGQAPAVGTQVTVQYKIVSRTTEESLEELNLQFIRSESAVSDQGKAERRAEKSSVAKGESIY